MSQSTIEVDVFPLPAHWASAIINGDETGLSPVESYACWAEVAMISSAGWDLVDIEGEPYFTWNYRRYGGDADGGNVCDFIAVRKRAYSWEA